MVFQTAWDMWKFIKAHYGCLILRSPTEFLASWLAGFQTQVSCDTGLPCSLATEIITVLHHPLDHGIFLASNSN